MKITKSENCGNSPKNAFIEDFIARLFRRESLADLAAEDIAIEVAGSSVQRGIEELSLERLFPEGVSELTIFDAISHGKKGAIDLKLLTSQKETLHVGIFLEFKSLKADRIAYLKIIVGTR